MESACSTGCIFIIFIETKVLKDGECPGLKS